MNRFSQEIIMSAPIIFIDGDQGTTGLQIHEQLRHRSDLTLLTLPEADRKNPVRRAEAINQCDIAILCLPDAAAREAVASITNPHVRVIDASSAHRTTAGWTYGFPEMTAGQAQRIAQAQRVSNPGCYPTGAISLLRPLQEARLLPVDLPVSVHAISGYSGSGRSGINTYEGPDASQAAPYLAYGLGLEHKHTPEIQQHALLAHRPIFLPSYAAYRQGIVLTIPLNLGLLTPGISSDKLRDTLTAHYAGSQYVQVVNKQDTQALTGLNPQQHNGTNNLTLGVLGNDTHQHAVLFAVFDNLGKGASGAAIQNLELMLNR